MESVSISELILSLKNSSQYDAVAEVLVARDERQKQIIETLKQDIETWANEELPARVIGEMSAERIYRSNLQKDTVKVYMEENEQLKKEIQTLQLQNEAQCASMDEFEHLIAELKKEIDELRNDMARGQGKDGDCQNSTAKVRKALNFRDIVHKSAAKKTTTKEDGSILGKAVEILESDDDCIVPANQSSKINTEQRVKRKRAKFIDLAHDEAAKNGTVGRRQFSAENYIDLVSQPLNGSVVLERCRTRILDVNAEKYSPLIKSAGLSQSADSSLSQKPKVKPRKGKLWNFEGEMAADLAVNDHLCMEAICALDKHRDSVEESLKNTAQDTNGPRLNLLRKAKFLADFLTNGDPDRRLKRSIAELRNWGNDSITECRLIAVDFSKELFEMYRKDEDLFASKS